MWESLPVTGNCNNVYNKPTDLHTQRPVRWPISEWVRIPLFSTTHLSRGHQLSALGASSKIEALPLDLEDTESMCCVSVALTQESFVAFSDTALAPPKTIGARAIIGMPGITLVQMHGANTRHLRACPVQATVQSYMY